MCSMKAECFFDARECVFDAQLVCVQSERWSDGVFPLASGASELGKLTLCGATPKPFWISPRTRLSGATQPDESHIGQNLPDASAMTFQRSDERGGDVDSSVVQLFAAIRHVTEMREPRALIHVEVSDGLAHFVAIQQNVTGQFSDGLSRERRLPGGRQAEEPECLATRFHCRIVVIQRLAEDAAESIGIMRCFFLYRIAKRSRKF